MKNNYGKRISPRWLVLIWLFSTTFSVLAQSNIPPIYWQRTLDQTALPVEFRSALVLSLSMARATDGGCVVLSQSGFTGKPFITKLGPAGNVVWTTSLATFGIPYVVQTTTTGDFLIASNSSTNPTNIILTKIGANGELIFNKDLSLPFDNNLQRTVRDLIPSPDGGFLIAGYESTLNTPKVRLDILLVKLDQYLNIQWTKRYAGSESTFLFKANRAADGGYIINSSTNSPTVTGNSNPDYNQIYNFKIDENGNVVWQRLGNEQSVFRDIVPTPTGYYAIGSSYLSGLAVMKFDQKLNMVQFTRLTDSNLNDNQERIAVRATPDGGCIVVDNYIGNDGSRDYRITKYNQSLDIEWQEKGGGPGDDEARVVSVNDDGTYFIGGSTNSPGLFGRIENSTNATIWVRKQASTVNALLLTQPTYNCETGAITFNTSGGDGSPITYFAPGISRASATSNTGVIEQGLRNDPKPILIQATQSGQTVSYRFDFAAYCVNQPDYPSPIASTVPDQTVKANVSYTYPAIEISSGRYNPATDKRYLAWSITAAGLPPGMSLTTSVLMKTFFLVSIGGTPTTPGVYPVTVTAINKDVPGSAPYITRFTITVLGSETSSSFALLAPTYTCTTGAITFNTSGGDGSPITYFAPGISRTSATSNTGVVEQGLRNDPKTILIQATQSGQTVSYSFDLKQYLTTSCGTDHQPTDGKELAILAPTYDCSNGAIHFNTIGGDGSSIEFMAIGITGWTTNPNQYVDKDSRTANDVQPFTLMARQNGRVVTYTWNLKEACGRARMAVEEVRSRLQVSVLGNPVEGEVADISITNALGQDVQINLLDLQGKSLFHHTIREAKESERLRIPVNAATGLLLLDVSTPTDRQQIKLLKR